MTDEGPLYPNQPLVEVATEVRFRGDLSLEQSRSAFQRKIYSTYPVLKAPNAVQGIAPSLQPYRFESEDGRAGVQLAINSISYFARDYPGCTEFLDAVKEATAAFFELIGSVDVTRLGWRYINAIPFTREAGQLPLKRIFKENSIFGSALTLEMDQVSYFSSKSLDDYRLNVRVESATSSTTPGEEEIILDIDAFEMYEPTATMGDSEISSAIRHKHDIARSIFEALITDEYRNFLRGSDNE